MSQEIVNESGLKPLGRAVLVKPYEPEINRSVLVMPDSVRERTAMLETRAVVIAIGPSCWDDEPRPRAQVGDKVMMSRMSGVLAVGTKDGQRYRVINDRDVYLQIEVE